VHTCTKTTSQQSLGCSSLHLHVPCTLASLVRRLEEAVALWWHGIAPKKRHLVGIISFSHLKRKRCLLCWLPIFLKFLIPTGKKATLSEQQQHLWIAFRTFIEQEEQKKLTFPLRLSLSPSLSWPFATTFSMPIEALSLFGF
jgi:hypothetical protein